VDDDPGTLQPLTVRATVADTSAVVDVDDGEATTGPVLGVVTQRRTGAYRGATVAGHNQRRRFALGAFKILIRRRVIEGKGAETHLRGELDELGNREVTRVHDILETALEDLRGTTAQVHFHDCRRTYG